MTTQANDQHPVPPGVPLVPGFPGMAPLRLAAVNPGPAPADFYLPVRGAAVDRHGLEMVFQAGSEVPAAWWESQVRHGQGQVFVPLSQLGPLAAELAEHAYQGLRAEERVERQALLWQEAVLAQLRLGFEGGLDAVELGRRIAQTQRLVERLARGGAALEALPSALLTDYSVFHHSTNVSLTAMAFGRFLGLDVAAQTTLGVAGLWHDLGMATLPRGLLEKPGPFSAEERGRMQEHPEQGYRLLLPVGEVSYDLMMIVRHHHENSDGSGYPEGLTAERIPWLARVMRLADAFEAMTHRRPYQPAQSQLNAARQLMESMVDQFGGDLAPAFLEFLASPPLAA